MPVDKLEYFSNKVIADAEAVKRDAEALTIAINDLYKSLGEFRKFKEEQL